MKLYKHYDPQEEALIAQLEQLIQSHDWYFSFSDDSGVYDRGSVREALIYSLGRKLAKPVIDQLWKNVPEQFPKPYEVPLH